MNVAPGCATHISLDASFVDHLIDVVGSDAGLCRGGGNVEDFPSESAALPHCLLPSRVEDLDLVAGGQVAAVSGVAILPPDGVGDRLGQGSML